VVRPLKPENVAEVTLEKLYHVLQELEVLRQTRYDVALADVDHVSLAELREIPVAPLAGLNLLNAPGKTAAGFTVRLMDFVADDSPSLTTTLKVYVVAVVGVPATVPLVTVSPLLLQAESPVTVQV
jgi:hypothetical protein